MFAQPHSDPRPPRTAAAAATASPPRSSPPGPFASSSSGTGRRHHSSCLNLKTLSLRGHLVRATCVGRAGVRHERVDMSTHLAAMNATALQKPDLRTRGDSPALRPENCVSRRFSNPILRPGARPRHRCPVNAKSQSRGSSQSDPKSALHIFLGSLPLQTETSMPNARKNSSRHSPHTEKKEKPLLLS
jgi:hypothetical protein